MRSDMRALLALEDGRFFEGESFGATGTRVGEICFNTAMTGYQEILTDPSYRGQIVAMTYPLIGNYGTNSLDQESRSPHVRGFIIEELTEVPSNWRSEMSLGEYLQKWKIPGAQGIDTRALTRHLRTRGAMKACLTTGEISAEDATRRAIEGEGVIGMDYVREVSTAEIYRWDPDDKLSAQWSIADCGLRLWDEGKYLAPAAPERLRRHRFPGIDNRRGSAGHRSRRNLSFQRPRRSSRAAVRAQGCARFDGQETDFRNLPWPSNSRLRVRGIDLQIEVRASRREPAGERFAERQGCDHRAKSWFRCRSKVVALERGNYPHQSKRRHRRGDEAQGIADL